MRLVDRSVSILELCAGHNSSLSRTTMINSGFVRLKYHITCYMSIDMGEIVRFEGNSLLGETTLGEASRRAM